MESDLSSKAARERNTRIQKERYLAQEAEEEEERKKESSEAGAVVHNEPN
jgi:hypothetical protein